MSKTVEQVEHQIRQLAPDERSALFERIDDLYEAEVARERLLMRDAVMSRGIDPDDDEAVQRLVDEVRYGTAGDHVG